MSIIGEGFNAIKELRKWQKEYQKNNDKDTYIHRLEDLIDKAEKENDELRSRIATFENKGLVLNEEHKIILQNFYENDWEYKGESIDALIDSTERDLSLHELMDNGYIHYFGNTYIGYTYRIEQGMRSEVLRIITSYKKDAENKAANEKLQNALENFYYD